MKKVIFVIIFASVTLCLFLFYTFAQEAVNQPDTKYSFNLAKQKIKVFMGDFKNSSPETQIDLREMANILKDTLINRKDIFFSTVTKPNEADIEISCDVKKFDYKETDPIDSYMGSAALVMDMLVKQNYAMMEVEFNIKDIKENKSTMQLVKSKFNKSNMPRHESYAFIMKEIAKDFIREYFYPKNEKGKSGRKGPL